MAALETLELRTLLTANPIGDQFLVNEAIELEGSPPSVAVIESTGNFIATWTSFEQLGGDESGQGVYAQRFLPDGTPIGGDFLVNTGFTTGDQRASDVATDALGNFVIVWESFDQDGDGAGIYAQRYNSSGIAQGDAFRVNQFTIGDQSYPTIAMANNGIFVIAWQSFGQDGDGFGIYARRFMADGTSIDADDVPVNGTFVGNQTAPAAAVARASGNFVITWEGEVTTDEASVEVFARLFGADGSTLRNEFQVNSIVPRDQVAPDVAMDADGDFVVAWTSEGQTGSGSDIFAQRFDAAGDSAGGEFRVNETTLQGQRDAAVGMDSDGDFLVTWQSSHQDQFSWGIFGRAYDSEGDVLTTEFQVNSFAEQPQTSPALGVNTNGDAVALWLGLDADHMPAVHAQRYQLPGPEFASVGSEIVLSNYTELEEATAASAVDADRKFVVVWQSYGVDGSGLGIQGRRFSATGEPLDEAFVVNTTIEGNQATPDVAMDRDGNFVVVWQGPDAEGSGIYAQRFDATGNPQGDEFQVNSAVGGNQSHPVVAMDPDDGRFIVAWQGPDADGLGIFAQKFDELGNAVGSEILVNTFEDLAQVSPAVDMNAAGEFVVVWVSDHRAVIDPEDSEKSIFAQWFDADGVATGEEVLVHTIVPDAEAQEYPDVAIDAEGNFVVVWQSITQDGSAWGVFGRQFLANKTPVQPAEFQINQTTAENQRRATVVSDPDGNFTVAWQSDLQDQSATAILSRQYNANGTPETDEMLVNTWELGPQILPVMAMTPVGDFGIFWIGQGKARTEGVHGRIYQEGYVPPSPHIDVNPIGDQFLVSETTGLEQSNPAVAVIESTGDYVAVWTSFEQPDGDTSGLGVYAQRFLADGTPKEPAFLVNSNYTADDQSAPAVAVDSEGNFVVVWQSLFQDGDGSGIYTQRYLADGTPDGSAFPVNTTTDGDQEKPAIAMDNAGNFVITWQSSNQDGDGYGIFARHFAANGGVVSAEFQVNSTSDGNQVTPTVARSRETGQFLIAWQSEVLSDEPDVEPNVEIIAQRFNADTTFAGDEFQINSISTRDQVDPFAAMDADGDFVVAWTSEGQQGSGADVYARRFNADGIGQSDDFRVNVTTAQGQQFPAVAMDAEGNFLVSWQSSHQDGFSWGIFAQVYDAAGTVLVPEFQVNRNAQGPQINPAISANSEGTTVVAWLGLDESHQSAVHAQRFVLPDPGVDFAVGAEGEVVLNNYVALEEAPAAAGVDARGNTVVVWESYGDDGSGLGVFGQRLGVFGQPIGEAFLVTTATDGNQGNPDVAVADDGSFVVVWQAIGQDGDGYGIFAQQFDSQGARIGGEFQVNSVVDGDQTHPAIAIDSDSGAFVVVWQGPDGDGTGIFGQRYNPTGQTLGDEFSVNTFTDLDQFSPRVSMNDAGQFVVAWVSDHRAVFDPNDTEKSIFVRAYGSNGEPSDVEQLVHSIQSGFDAQEQPDLAIDAEGNFVIVWQSINQDGNSWGVFARQFQADLTPVQPEFQVNQTVLAPQRNPSVALDAHGNFLIAWQSHMQDSSGPGVFARVYDSTAVPQTDEFLLPTADQGPQSLPVVAMRPNGQAGIFWIGHGTDRIEGVHGRIFDLEEMAINSIVGRASTGTIVVSELAEGQLQTRSAGAVPLSVDWDNFLVGDFDGDGHDDLAGLSPSDGYWRVLKNDGTLFSAPKLWNRWSTNVSWTDLMVGDFNNDGFDDVAGRASTGTWNVSLSDGVRFHSMNFGSWSTASAWHDVQTGDFNGDGLSDILGRSASGKWVAGISDGARFRMSTFATWSTNVTWNDVSVGDFNGDGLDDIAGRASTGTWVVGMSTGSSFQSSVFGAWSNTAGFTDVRFGDFNGDGRSDVTGRSASGRQVVGLSDGTRFVTQEWGNLSTNVSWPQLLVGDYNKDGRSDLLLHASSGTWVSGLSTGSAFTFGPLGSWSTAVTWDNIAVGQFI